MFKRAINGNNIVEAEKANPSKDGDAKLRG